MKKWETYEGDRDPGSHGTFFSDCPQDLESGKDTWVPKVTYGFFCLGLPSVKCDSVSMEDGPLYPRDEKKKPKLESWIRFKEWNKFLRSIPDQDPVIKKAIRPKGFSGVFFYRLVGLNYEELAIKWYGDRNVTLRKGFVEYLSQLYSLLITPEILPDGTLANETTGVELYSLDLKKINRNYSEFNDVLLKNGFLDVLSLHDADEKKCIKYAAPMELLWKGVERVYLSKEDKKTLVKSIRVSKKRDQTSSGLDQVCRYYVKQLGRTTVDPKEFREMEIELGMFRELYPKVVRHRQGKLDLKIGLKEGRLYSTYLYAPKIFRRLLRWNKKHPMVEGDVAASHFHFLLAEMTDPNEREEMKKDLISSDPYLSMCGNPPGVSREDLKESSHRFKYGSRLKKYPKLTDCEWWEIRRKKRTLLYRDGLFYKHLSSKYPKFAHAMAEMKIFGAKQKKRFSCEIMRRESDVMVRMVGERCRLEKLVYLPVHDGFLTLPEQYDRVCEVITDAFQQKVGSVPRIRRKG